MTAYYNEIEPYAAEWLRNLIKAGLIPDGEVDTRSIVDVSADDLRGFTQCHFFAGIGGWAYALRLAGWPDDREVYTGSCPCQPFSVAGKGLGTDDPRHLWPHFHRLIRAARPPVVMGEQVAGAAGYGWFDGVAADLEAENYISRAVDIPACSVNAPHIRSRLYWVASDVAHPSNDGAGGDIRAVGDSERGTLAAGSTGLRQTHRQGCADWLDARSAGDMADAQIVGRKERERKDGQQDARGCSQGRVDVAGVDEGHMADAGCRRDERGSRPSEAHGEAGAAEGEAQQRERGRAILGDSGAGSLGGNSHMADADSPAEQRRWRELSETQGQEARWSDNGSRGAGSFWSNAIWLTGADGKTRRAEPSIPLLAHGIPARVGRLRAYGNAIVPQVAAEVIAAFMEEEACQPRY